MWAPILSDFINNKLVRLVHLRVRWQKFIFSGGRISITHQVYKGEGVQWSDLLEAVQKELA